MFVVIGVIGALLLVSTFVFDDVLDEMIPGLDFLSGPVVGAFLVAFGAFGWFLSDGADAGIALAVLAAVAGGAVFGGVTYGATRTLMHQPTDATPTTASLVGASARVVTPIRSGGVGEILVALGGAPTKYTATASTDIAAGETVVVIAVESPTKVRVQTESEFWS